MCVCWSIFCRVLGKYSFWLGLNLSNSAFFAHQTAFCRKPSRLSSHPCDRVSCFILLSSPHEHLLCICSDPVVCSGGFAETVRDGVCDAGKLIAPNVPTWVCFALHCYFGSTRHFLRELFSGVAERTEFRKVRNICPNGDYPLGRLTHSPPSTHFRTLNLGLDRVASVV